VCTASTPAAAAAAAVVQVLRALQPPLTADMCSTLLSCLQQCLAAADASHVAREVALELLLTLRSLLEVLPARKLLLYPQVYINRNAWCKGCLRATLLPMNSPSSHSLSEVWPNGRKRTCFSIAVICERKGTIHMS
jgi:hypothetical protein